MHQTCFTRSDESSDPNSHSLCERVLWSDDASSNRSVGRTCLFISDIYHSYDSGLMLQSEQRSDDTYEREKQALYSSKVRFTLSHSQSKWRSVRLCFQVVYVARNPKDNVLSAMHHYSVNKAHNFAGTQDEFIDFYTDDIRKCFCYFFHQKSYITIACAEINWYNF